MKNKKFRVFCMLIVTLGILFTGCTNKEFVNDYNKYNSLYVEVINEIVTESGDNIEKLKEENVVEKLEQMDEIADRMNKTASAKKEKSMLSNVLLYEEGIDLLRKFADNTDDLTRDEKLERLSAIAQAEGRKADIEDGNIIR